MSLLEQERIYKAYERSILGESKKKDCPDGHEWDEKTQECLPSSTGIKESEQLSKHQKALDAVTGKLRVADKAWARAKKLIKDDIDIPMREKGQVIRQTNVVDSSLHNVYATIRNIFSLLKLNLESEKKECPEGHEWDEKMQECLPSSTGIKEEELDERLGEKGRTKEGMIEKRGTEKVKKAAGYLEIAIKLLADARKFEIYTKEGMKASKEEIQTLTKMRKELEARVESLG